MVVTASGSVTLSSEVQVAEEVVEEATEETVTAEVPTEEVGKD